MIDSSKPPGATSVLNDLIKQISVSSMETFCRRSGFSFADFKSNRAVKDHWMSQVVVSGPGLRVYFQFFFSAAVLKNWANQIYKNSKEIITLEQVHDFAKEYCNLVGGRLKKSLIKSGIKTGVSLPVVSRGFDRIFISADDLKNCVVDEWVLCQENLSAICSTEIEVTNKFVLEKELLQDEETDEIRLL